MRIRLIPRSILRDQTENDEEGGHLSWFPTCALDICRAAVGFWYELVPQSYPVMHAEVHRKC